MQFDKYAHTHTYTQAQRGKRGEDPLAAQPDREFELSQTNRGLGGVCVGVVPLPPIKALARPPRSPWEEAPARSPNPRKYDDEESYGKVQRRAGEG